MRISLKKYKDKKILITGGTGFIGCNIAEALVNLGADITILSRNKRNVIPGTEIVTGDIRDEKLMNRIVKDKEIIFNLAAQVSHMDKNIISYDDLDINCRGQLTLLESCRIHNPKVKIVFSSTRMVYGENTENPIKEDHSTNPVSIYGIHKLTAEKYHLTYYKKYNINSTILRISNPYGDRQHLSKGLYSLPGWFMSRAINGETIEITSSGKQMRDYIYIKDLVEAMLRVGLSEKTNGEIYNCGAGTRHTFTDMINAISETVKNGKFLYINKDKIKVDQITDSYYLDVKKLQKDINWKAGTKLQTGVKLMYRYAKKHPTNDNN